MTKKPRITITLEPTTYETLSRLSRVGDQSMSEIVTGFLEICVPSMERMVVVMERAKAAPQEARAGLEAAINAVELRMLPELAGSLEQQDMFLKLTVDEALGAAASAGVAERARQAAAAPSTPGLVTRGSGQRKSYKLPAMGGQRGPV